MKQAGLVFSNTELKFTTLERLAELKEQDRIWRMENWNTFNQNGQSPLVKKLTKANELRRLEILRDEKEAGGWWEDGVWVDGVESGKGGNRWFALDFEGEEEDDDDVRRIINKALAAPLGFRDREVRRALEDLNKQGVSYGVISL